MIFLDNINVLKYNNAPFSSSLMQTIIENVKKQSLTKYKFFN